MKLFEMIYQQIPVHGSLSYSEIHDLVQFRLIYRAFYAIRGVKPKVLDC